MNGNANIGTGDSVDVNPVSMLQQAQQNPTSRYMDRQIDYNQVRSNSQSQATSTSCTHTWIYNRARPLQSWYALKRRQDEFLKAKEDAFRLHESLKQQHENQWTEQCRLLELKNKKLLPTDLENGFGLNNISCSSEANDKKQVATKSKKKKSNKKGKRTGESLKKAEDSDISEKNYESGEIEERDVADEQESETKADNFLLHRKETKNKLDKDFDDRLTKLNKQKEKFIEDHLKTEMQLEKDRTEFIVEFERHLADIDRKSRNLSNARALRERIHFMEREVNKKEHLTSDMQAYIHELEGKMRYMNNTISRLQQEVSDFQFEKLQLNNQIVEKDNQLSMIMTMNPHIMMNLQGFTDTIYYDCPDVMQSIEPGPQQVVESVEDPSSTSLNDIRDRYDDLLAEFPENDANEEVNWTLTMISKIVDYYETIGKSVYEEISPNKYISTLILADKSDPVPNKYEGTVAVGNGDTPLEATQCAVQWAYGYIQSCIVNDSNGNSTLRAGPDPELVTSSPHFLDNLNDKTTGNCSDEDGTPESIVGNGCYSSAGSSVKSVKQKSGDGENDKKSPTCNNSTITNADTKPRNLENVVVSSDQDLSKNQNNVEGGLVNPGRKVSEDLDGVEKVRNALNSITVSSPSPAENTSYSDAKVLI